jgi:hypothetical protein
LDGEGVVAVQGACHEAALEFFEAGLDRDCVGFLVEVVGGEPVGETKDTAEHSSLAGGDLVEEGWV